MPFLGPLVAAWIILAVGVMATYFLVVARNDGRVEEPWEAPFRQPREPAASTRWVRPQWAASQPQEPDIAPTPRYSNLPAYDMEDFPDDHWTSGDPVTPDPQPQPPTRPVRSPWAASPPPPSPPPPPPAPRPTPPTPARGSVYDMEDFPADNWGSLPR